MEKNSTINPANAWPLSLFRKACATNPVYREFVESRGVDVSVIGHLSQFSQLPVMDKKYLTENPRARLFAGGRLPVSASCSSGSSGKPTYWFRSEADDRAAAEGYKYLIANVLGIRKEENVLALVCFAMGSWVAGTLTVDCLKLIAQDGYNITVFPAGIDREDGLNALQHLGPEFDHILIYGYPPLLLDFVKEAKSRNIPMGPKVKLIPAGDKNSEAWRETAASFAGCPQEQVMSFYGSADALYMACETPLTLAIKKAALASPALYETLFGDIHVANMPGLYQYDEKHIFFEEIGGELVLSIDRTLPLLRYNLRDRVRLFRHDDMRAILEQAGPEIGSIDILLRQWHLPFVSVMSRSDVAVNYYGINIYYDHIRNIAEAPEMASLLSGNYFAGVENRYEESRQYLHLEFELHPGLDGNPETEGRVQQAALDILRQTNSEFRKLYESLREKAVPKVRTVPNGALGARSAGIYAEKGKKPRMINPVKQ
jgi:phenylacetate-CoA ligase